MLYEEYLVTACGIKEGREWRDYFCELVSRNGHKINFSLIIQGCVGEKEYGAQYEAISPHIHVGDLLQCEFAWQWQYSFFQLCLSGFLPLKVRRINSQDPEEVVSPQDHFNSNRGYWTIAVPSGQWIRFLGLITCGGDSCMRANFEGARPELISDPLNPANATGELVWKPKLVKRKNAGTIVMRRIIRKLIPALSA